MSIDDTAKRVWETTRPPLAMLVAGQAIEVFLEPLTEDERAAFHALSRALEEWWPRRQRDPEDIYNVEFSACLMAVADAESEKKIQPAMNAAYVQMAHLLKTKPKSLPADGYYDMSEDDFVALMRSSAKASKLPLAQLDSRLKMLLERKKEDWPTLVERTSRMHWGRTPPWGKLDKRLRTLAALADLGAKASWRQVGAQNALVLALDDVKRTTVLAEEELAALRVVIPSIPAAPA